MTDSTLTDLDRIAIVAMQGMLANSRISFLLDTDQIPNTAYDLAARMLKKRDLIKLEKEELQKLEEELSKLDQRKIDILDIPNRTYNCLKYENISIIGQLILMTERDLLRIPNLGRKGVNQINEALSMLQLTLKADHDLHK